MWLWLMRIPREQARNLRRCALKAAKLQHAKLKTLHTWLIPMRKAECGKIEDRPSLKSITLSLWLMTLCEVLWWNHSRSVTKNLTPYRFNSAGWGLDGQNAEIHSFPTMYNTWGCLLGRNGSKQWFSPKKWSKNSFFEYHDSGSSNFGLGWDPKF